MALQFTDQPQPDTERKKLLRVTPNMLISVLKQGKAWQCLAGLPLDTKVIATQYKFETNEIEMIVISDSFEMVSQAAITPLVESPILKMLAY